MFRRLLAGRSGLLPARRLLPPGSLLLLMTLTMAGGTVIPGVRAQLVGGTLPVSPKTEVRLDLTGADVLVFHCAKSETRVPYARINTLEYGQNVSRRYAAAVLISPVLLLSKTRKHFLTIGYADGEDRQQAMVLRVEKGDIRSVLASLEARTGRRVVNLDDDARKGAK
jgi:hypothetical protein